MSTKVKFKESISCMDGSFSAGQVVLLDDRLAAPWLKTGMVEAVEKDPVTPVEAPVAYAPFVAKDNPEQFKQKPVLKPEAPKKGLVKKGK
jgi:hypothetical protein